MFKLDLVCEYKDRCEGYRDDSETCTKALDKNFCGTYRQFEKEGVAQ
ncbi:MAG: hypothetical protein ABFD07_02925 [Methanobacterium sp.]